MASITAATKRKWIREAAQYLPPVRAARVAALRLRRESLGKTYTIASGARFPLNYMERLRLAAAYCEARATYHHLLARWRAFEVNP